MALRLRQNSNSSFIIRKKSSKRKFSFDNFSQQKTIPKVLNAQIPLSNKKLTLQTLLSSENKVKSKIEMFERLIFDFGHQKSLGPERNSLLNFQKNGQKQNLSKYSQNQNTTIVVDNHSIDSISCLNLQNSYSKTVNSNYRSQKNRLSENLRIQSQQNIRSLLFKPLDLKSEASITHKIQIGTQTQTSQRNQIDRQSYQQFLKFKLTKKQSFEKLQNLFKFIENLTKVEGQNFTNSIQKIKQIFGDNTNDERQKRVDQLMREIPLAFKKFKKCYKEVFKQQNNIINQVLTKDQSKTIFLNDLITQIEKNIQCLFCEKQFFKQKVEFKQIKPILQQIKNKHQAVFQRNWSFLTNKIYRSDQNSQYLEFVFNQWEKKIIQQQTLIKNCVLNISELPQICMTIFGIEDKANIHEQTNLQIQKYGVRVNKIPHISDFFIRRDHQNAKQIDQTFSKCCEIKCMNCVYLRSKMKYIERKNIELQPILRVLMQLINWQDQKIYNHPNFAQRVTEKCFNKKIENNLAKY